MPKLPTRTAPLRTRRPAPALAPAGCGMRDAGCGGSCGGPAASRSRHRTRCTPRGRRAGQPATNAAVSGVSAAQRSSHPPVHTAWGCSTQLLPSPATRTLRGAASQRGSSNCRSLVVALRAAGRGDDSWTRSSEWRQGCCGSVASHCVLDGAMHCRAWPAGRVARRRGTTIAARRLACPSRSPQPIPAQPSPARPDQARPSPPGHSP